MQMRATILFVTLAAVPSAVQSQPAPIGAQFEVVSIKPHPYDPATGGGIRMLPDGSLKMTSVPVVSILASAAPEPVSEVTGYPAWARSDPYDIIAKPPADSHPTLEQRAEMMRNMLVDRLKVAGHVEEVERTTFALVLARSDGRFGPQLKPSSADCASPPLDGAQPPQGSAGRCGTRMGQGTIEATGASVDRLVLSLRGLAGGQVTNRTGLQGLYDVSLRFTPPRLDVGAVSDTDAPEFATALQEQLGLKLVREKTKVKVFVIDHIERPTPD
jgi:uncharacterized protein (TIGR03435 family)